MSGIVVGNNGPLQQFLVAFPIQPTQQIFQVWVETKDFSVRLREYRLVRIERREALQLNQLGLQLA